MIRVENLTKRFDDRPAIVDLTFHVPAGQVAGILGPPGSGKSTVMRILAGYLVAGSGSVHVAGLEAARRARELQRRVGYVPQAAPLYRELTPEEHLKLLATARGIPLARRGGRIDDALTVSDLLDHRALPVARLTSATRRRLALAIAAVHEPEVLLLDEPFEGLGAEPAAGLRTLVARLCRGRTALIASRHPRDLEGLCERVLVVDAGRLVADGAPSELSRRFAVAGPHRFEATVRGDAAGIEHALAGIGVVREIRIDDSGGGEWRVLVSGDSPELGELVTRAV